MGFPILVRWHLYIEMGPRTDYILIMVCWFSSFWCHFDLVKQVKFGVSGDFCSERMERMAKNLVCWYILTTCLTDYFLVMLCWFSSFWWYFVWVKQVKFSVSGHFIEKTKEKWAEICHADTSWPPAQLIQFWSWSVKFPHFSFMSAMWCCANLISDWPLPVKGCHSY